MTSVAPEPTLPSDENERDKKLRHAQYLIDNGYIKNVTLDQLLRSMDAPADKPKTLPQSGKMDTFGDLTDFYDSN